MDDYGRDYNIEVIDVDQLLSKAAERHMTGWRLAQICAVYIEEHQQYELSYSFENVYELLTYRIKIDKSTNVPSITQIYHAAFLYENEMKELFGVQISYMANDYRGKLYRIDEETPFIGKGDK
jgi:NADH:ubiquinone oxidoreductase 27 kD subunit